ncbi:lipoprotein-releasing system ATP-binding protein [Nonlabens dokdonensis]|uniref:Lipoprotein releasing system ATP-binding ABC transporter n=2 Tax=Nonlabens dokdonensis TaxID=328515 RepID=L7W8Y5_NONDD|nr:ABC transporter ATP-binding protein [Nonlabens dokdonensis]AGC78180.1 lipoprotein releasing system ATP-binding ABC transporter [Nonlabens dokdonensis DSW-6]PZX37927.1 lipoprotein-releasing system ATP-binding protein [Nonlabens dokdonensis]
MIKATQIYKSFGDLQVLKGVDLEIKTGEIASVVGSSGAGKTTLLHILGTLEQPDTKQESSLYIDGTDILKLKGKQLSKFRNNSLGFIFQFHQLLPEFTALENVCIPAYIANTDKAVAEKRAKELLSYLKLSGRFDHKPGALSGGEQQRVAVARALINNPKVIFADEPTGNLDSATANDLHELIFQLRKEFNQTFVIVTHNEELADLADRKLVMSDGKFL